jgi:hypothetical protein
MISILSFYYITIVSDIQAQSPSFVHSIRTVMQKTMESADFSFCVSDAAFCGIRPETTGIRTNVPSKNNHQRANYILFM